MKAKRLSPPTGAAPPETATAPGGGEVALDPLAREVARRHADEFPDEGAEYGAAWEEWCIHDMKHVLAWALFEQTGLMDFERNIRWLVRVLGARDYPLERLARSLEMAADTVSSRGEAWSPSTAATLVEGAEIARSASA